MFSLLPLTILYFSCYAEVSLDFELERIEKKIKYFSKHIVSDGQMELILKQKCTFIWCLTILIHHFVLIFSTLSQKNRGKNWKKVEKEKEKKYSVKLHHFLFEFYVGWTCFRSLMIYQSRITINIRNTSSVTALSNLRLS